MTDRNQNATSADPMTPYGLTDTENDEAFAAADRAHAYLNDHLSGAVKKITDDIHESVHNYVMEMMESDTRYNFANLVRSRVNTIIQGLLSGSWAEGEARKWLEGYDFAKYRQAIYEANRGVIENKLLDDLLAENKRLKEDLEYARKRY